MTGYHRQSTLENKKIRKKNAKRFNYVNVNAIFLILFLKLAIIQINLSKNLIFFFFISQITPENYASTPCNKNP